MCYDIDIYVAITLVIIVVQQIHRYDSNIIIRLEIKTITSIHKS